MNPKINIRVPFDLVDATIESLLALTLYALVALLMMLGFSGCARFHSVQIQTKLDGTQIESRQTITTFWDSQSSLAKLRASTSDKSQSLTVSGFAEESSGTNAVTLLEHVTSAAVSAAISAAKTP